MTSTQTLLFDSSKSAADFASGMIDWELWTSGRSKKAAARKERAADICKLMRSLEIERSRREREKKNVSAIDSVASELALELCDLANEAETDKSFRPGSYDPFALTCVRMLDDMDRRILRGCAN